ncbi:MAG: hypothetical protein WBF99_06305 [Xanthobacteraceae bacterium]
MVNTDFEYKYRLSYIDGVYDVLKATRKLQVQGPWIDALIAWENGPVDACHAPPQPDGKSMGVASAFDTAWQSARCRGYSQGLDAALQAVKADVAPSQRIRLEKWRDRVLKWRNTNGSRTRRGLPSPPPY